MFTKEQFEKTVQEVHAVLKEDGSNGKALLEAEAKLEQLMTVERMNPGLVFLMACVYVRMARYATAEHLLWRAIELAPDMHAAWNNLGYIYRGEGRYPEAEKVFAKAKEIAPEDEEILCNSAGMYINNGTPDLAIETCNQLLEKVPGHVDARWNRSLAYLEKGDWVRGWRDYNAGLEVQKDSAGNRKGRDYPNNAPLWDGTPGKRVVIYGEQGVGDEIMAMSMLPDAMKDIDIILDIHPRLVNLARHAWGDKMPIYGTRKAEVQDLAWTKWTPFDAKCPIMNLGQYYRLSDKSFPKEMYMKPFDKYVEQAETWLQQYGSDRPRIGISWMGGTAMTRADLRNIPLPDWTPILKSIDATWVSLQYDPAEQPGMWAPLIEKFNEHEGTNLIHDETWINDLDMCYGGLIQNLDLIISVNTSIVHACGAMGVPCWTLTPSRPAWRYGMSGDQMPWYGHWVKTIRQKDDDWGPVLREVEAQLAELFVEEAA